MANTPMPAILPLDSVHFDLTAKNKRDLLEQISSLGASLSGLHEKVVLDALLQRERLGTTGTGEGVAIPHSRFSNLDRIYGMFIRLSEPVAFEAIDEQPVDLIFTLLVPENAGADHLKALAEIAKMFRDKNARAALRKAESPQKVKLLFSEAAKANAA